MTSPTIAQTITNSRDVLIPNLGWQTAVTIIYPDDFDEKRKYPAVLGAHPIGSCKKQTAGNVYGVALAQAGFVVVTFDASFQGSSGGHPRNIEDPGLRVSDFRFVLDYMVTLPYIDSEKIGAYGICGGGGYVVAATMTDFRIKACVSITGVNFGRLMREGFSQYNPVEALKGIAAQRTAEARGAERKQVQYLFPRVEDAKKTTTDVDLVEATDYYRNRSPHRCALTSGLLSFNAAATMWDDYAHAEVLLTQPFMAVVGDIPGGFGAYRDGNEIYARAASAEKELVVLAGITHYELYDHPKAAGKALESITPFFKKHLV
ncbi:hypothetical protein Q8F55_007741 [Vanrija albida]|uniref:Xaa-Pro dipeptidyl-peptidase-like domain-containing protein n=1 Tax=Vanrija albida TaxID=181172 RepID=A0ABR3PUF0_9TREE